MFHVHPNDPKSVMCLAFRLTFGLSLLLVGVSHYMTLSDFTGMVSSGLGPLQGLGVLWAYILPALMIIGGVLFVVGMYKHIAAWAAGIALGSIPVGMLLKPVLGGVALGEAMAMANNALLWFIIYYFAVKCCCCCSGGSCAGGSCAGGTCECH